MRPNALIPSLASIALLMAGCAGEFEAKPLAYSKSKQVVDMADGTKQAAVVRALSELFGPSPRDIKVPEGLGLRRGGAYLANYVTDETGAIQPLAFVDKSGNKQQVAGGYSLYRKHCLHCHGVSGDGNGPTADYLYPRPRDYRKGLFKFTSTASGAKPSRDDLWRTINFGLHGTSMPGFEALMSQSEIQQVVDYVIFLSIRGETEIMIAQDVADGAWDDQIKTDASKTGFATTEWYKKPADSAIYPLAVESLTMVSDKWNMAESQLFNPPVPRVATSNESIQRGRELFLGYTKERLECWGCHGIKAEGNGKSFVDRTIYEKVVFGKHAYLSIHTDDDRSLAITEAAASRLKEIRDEQASRLRTVGIGEHGHGGGEANHALLQGWVATLTVKSGTVTPSESDIHHHLEHAYPGVKFVLKTDGTTDNPIFAVTPAGHVKPQLVADVTASLKDAVFSAIGGVEDGKGWVVTYSTLVDVNAEATEAQKQITRRKAEIMAEAVRAKLLAALPAAQITVVLADTAPEAEIAVAPVSDANAGKTAQVQLLVTESVNEVKNYFSKTQTDWTASLDDWQMPLRPANLNTGTYKGGLRPIDIYWRIAKGINGAKMPAHETTLKPEQIWDLVNFVLAIPSRPELLRDATEPVRNDAAPAQVAATN